MHNAYICIYVAVLTDPTPAHREICVSNVGGFKLQHKWSIPSPDAERVHVFSRKVFSLGVQESLGTEAFAFCEVLKRFFDYITSELYKLFCYSYDLRYSVKNALLCKSCATSQMQALIQHSRCKNM
jgi:hypothetical protein